MRFLSYIYLSFLLFNSAWASSLIDDRLFNKIIDSGAISGGISTAILQDHNDIIWIGTQQGLLRYDGYQFKKFNVNSDEPNSISGNYVRSLALTPDGRIWIGTLSNGLSIYDPKTATFENHRHEPTSSHSISNDRIDTLAVDNKGGVWIGTNNGLDYWYPEQNGFIRYTHSEGDKTSINDNHIRALLIDDNHNLWVGSWKGLNKLRPNSKHFESVFENQDAEISLDNKNILRLFQDNTGVIWFGTPEQGGGWFDPNTKQVNWLPLDQAQQLSLSHAWVTGIAQVSEQELWIATYGGGINVIDRQTKTIIRHIRHDASIPSSLGSDEIGPLLMDKSGLLWVGTWGAGLHQYNATNLAFEMYRYSSVRENALSHENILSILEVENGNLWVGTGGKGIDIVDLKLGVIGGYRVNVNDNCSLVDGTISALKQASNSVIWVGTRQGGLHKYSAETNCFKQFSIADGLINNYIHQLLISGNTLWIATSGGLNRFDINTEQFQTLSTQSDPEQPFIEQIDTLAMDDNGTLWVAAESGLYILAPNEGLLVAIEHDETRKSSLSDNDVQGLLVDADNQLWVSTRKGLDRLLSWDGKIAIFESISEKVGVSNVGKSLLQDDLGRVWPSAVYMMTLENWQLDYFDEVDGIDLGAMWGQTYAKMKDGRLLFGGSKGLAIIDPQKVSPWNYIPKVYITEVSVDGKNVTMHFPLTLDADTRSFTVEFSALDYSQPEKNHYKYRLVPYDKKWIETDSDRRIATYTNLEPGQYQLKIWGSNRLGQWNEKATVIDIKQQPAWYQTLAFYIVTLFLILVMLYLIYFIRVQQLKKNEFALKQMVLDRTSELEKALGKVELASLTDPLTQMHNRRYITEYINADLKLSLRAYNKDLSPEKSDLIFILFDIDYFKQVNDTYGHTAGDEVLVQFANILKETFRDSDMLIRWGGEEFLVVSRFVNRQNTALVVERVRQKIEAFSFELGGGKVIKKTSSIGYAAFPFVTSSPQKVDWQRVVDIADIALFAAKRSSRNAWVGLSALKDISPEELDQLLENPSTLIDKVVKVESSIKDLSHIQWN